MLENSISTSNRRHYRVTPRRVLGALSLALHELGVRIRALLAVSRVPGNVDTTLAPYGSEGLPLHLTHIQFHSTARRGAQVLLWCGADCGSHKSNKHISADVGQIMFGQTVTASGDTMAQHRNRKHAHPRKWVVMDIECDAGCGVVPFRYRDQNFVNALQWAIGLEIFLGVVDPWRIFLTTDHPNGAPFTTIRI